MRSAPFPRPASIVLALLPILLTAPAGRVAPGPPPAAAAAADTLEFEPTEPPDDFEPDDNELDYVEPIERARARHEERAWLKVPFHEHLLDSHHEGPLGHRADVDVALDFNRVDELRLGVTTQMQGDWALSPRFATRLEYATGRRRWLYGAQIEQPLDPGNHLAVGVSMIRATDHLDLNQVDDFENSLALLFGRQDYRDYFEREGVDAYAAARWPGVTTLSTHYRNDRYRSLEARDVDSWLHRSRGLRPNPPIAGGDIRSFALRLERHVRRVGGLYHWIEYEAAGHGLGGDFDYRRALADVRSVIRLSPAMTMTLRALGGSALAGDLPPQRTFTIGGVDGLRAHSFGAFRGDQVALGQTEYSVGFGRQRGGSFPGFHVIVFADAGSAWNNLAHHWDPGNQRFDLDGGFGLSTAEDNLRVYFAKDLRDPDADFVISARLQRPF